MITGQAGWWGVSTSSLEVHLTKKNKDSRSYQGAKCGQLGFPGPWVLTCGNKHYSESLGFRLINHFANCKRIFSLCLLDQVSMLRHTNLMLFPNPAVARTALSLRICVSLRNGIPSDIGGAVHHGHFIRHGVIYTNGIS